MNLDLSDLYPISYCEYLRYLYADANSTKSNITLPAVYWAIITISPVNLFVSLFGLILCFVFICRTKTNFMVRVLVYMTVGLTGLQVLPVLEYTLLMLSPINLYGLCHYFVFDSLPIGYVSYPTLIFYIFLLLIIFILGSTITITMMVSLCRHSCDCSSCCRRCNYGNISPLCKKCLETLCIAFVFGIPLVIFSSWFISNTDMFFLLFASVLYGILFAFLPLTFLISITGSVILIIWFCIRCRNVPRSTAKIISKEIFLFLSLFFVISLLGSVFVAEVIDFILSPPNKDISTLQFLSLTVLSPYPLCVFLYMWYSFRRPSTRRVRFAAAQEQRTGALKTTPDSTRVSAFSRTSQNYDPEMFFSPSTAGPTELTSLVY